MLKKPSSPLYTVKDLEFSYSLGKQKVLALSQLSLEIPSSSLIAFSGPSGSGKSTLLHILGLIEPFQKGEVFFLGESIKKMSRRKKNEMRRKKIGFIFQQFHLSPVLTAGENIAYFLARQKLPRKEIRARTDKALDMVGILNQKNKKMSDLSGGQKQRVAIARALAKNPDVIIGDEPTASLDQTTGKGIMQIFSDLVKEKQVSVILSTHDPMVYSYSDYNFHIQDGLVTELEAHP